MLFKDVLVEEGLKKQLISLVKENRVSHAQLFLGGAGTHKFALAIAYAQYLCCENRGEEDSCGVCPSCQKFSKLAHPDLHLVFPNCTTKKVPQDPDSRKFAKTFVDFVEQNRYHLDINKWLEVLEGENKQPSINIRDAANIINQNSIKAYEGGYKIFILWMADRLYRDAAPKLLKTLEEPENKTLFILLAESSDNILPTIISRTQLVKIPDMPTSMMVHELVEHYNVPQADAVDVAEVAEGSFVKALALLEDTSEMKEALSRFESLLSSALAHKKNDLKAVNYIEIQQLIDIIAKEEREKQKMFLVYVMRLFRNMLLMSAKQETLIKATAEEKQFLVNYYSCINLKNITPVVAECNRALQHIMRNVNGGLVFTDLYLKWAALL